MSTRAEFIYDVITILTKANFTDDSRLEPDYIGYKLDEKRAKEIRDSYARTSLIDPVWLQDYGVFDTTEVNYADDKTFSYLDCKLAKATLPPTVSFNNGIASINNLGDYSIRSVSGKEEFFFRQHSKLIEILNDIPESHPLRKFSYYTKVQNAHYFVAGNGLDIPKKARAILILESPLDGFVLTTENVTSLTIGTQYQVMSGQITSDSVIYTVADAPITFTATATSFTGSGIVQFLNQKRPMTNDDPYPFSKSQMEICILKLLTQEYQIEAGKIAQIRNISQDELRIMNEPST